jgi:hypothetical protein
VVGRLAWLAALALAGGARAEGLPCLASVSLEPERAVVGQQVLYRLQILRRAGVSSVRWVEPLSFPSFRAEWLPGRSPDPAISGIGEHFLVFEERRALFAARSGDLAIPAARLACDSGEPAPVEIEVPGARLHVDPIPSGGRPADFTGVIGRVEVTSRVSAARVALGSAVVLDVTVAGAANVWAAAAPLAERASIAGADLHPRPPALALDPGPELVARRSFVYDLVPRRIGAIAIPSIRVPWFDPDRGAFEVAEAPALELAVDAAPAPPAPAAAPPRPEPSAAPLAAESDSSWRWALGSALALLAASSLLAGARLALWRRAPRRAALPHLGRAGEALGRGDAQEGARALAAALRAALEARLPGARALAVEEIRARCGDDVAAGAAVEALAALERARFARAPAPPAPDLARVRALVRRL